jgi:hypothetical protein
MTDNEKQRILAGMASPKMGAPARPEVPNLPQSASEAPVLTVLAAA